VERCDRCGHETLDFLEVDYIRPLGHVRRGWFSIWKCRVCGRWDVRPEVEDEAEEVYLEEATPDV